MGAGLGKPGWAGQACSLSFLSSTFLLLLPPSSLNILALELRKGNLIESMAKSHQFFFHQIPSNSFFPNAGNKNVLRNAKCITIELSERPHHHYSPCQLNSSYTGLLIVPPNKPVHSQLKPLSLALSSSWNSLPPWSPHTPVLMVQSLFPFWPLWISPAQWGLPWFLPSLFIHLLCFIFLHGIYNYFISWCFTSLSRLVSVSHNKT